MRLASNWKKEPNEKLMRKATDQDMTKHTAGPVLFLSPHANWPLENDNKKLQEYLMI